MNQDLKLPRNVAELAERETRLANRAGGLAIVTIFLAMVSAMAMPMAFRETLHSPAEPCFRIILPRCDSNSAVRRETL